MSTLTRIFFGRLMKWESGYQNMPQDTGNRNSCGKLVGTNRGITSKTVETLMGVKCPDETFMKGITEDYAFEVLTKFWSFYRIDQIRSQELAEQVMNHFMGLPKEAAKAVQRACNRFGANITEDGAMGSKTIAALNSLADQNLPAIYNAVLEEWLSYLSTTQEIFRQGLLNRVNDLFQPMIPATTTAPVATTVNADRVQLILSGALKGNLKDIIAIGIGLSAILIVFFSAMKLTAAR